MPSEKEQRERALWNAGEGRQDPGWRTREGHHDELGRPSRPFSGPQGQTRQVGKLGDQFERVQVELIICRRCDAEFRSFVDAVLHSC